MQFTKTVKVTILSTALFVSMQLSASVYFVGGPVLDGTNTTQNVIQNIAMIERHIKQVTDWKALQKLVKEKVKGEASSKGANDIAKEKGKQDLAEAVRNAEIAVQMAPVKIAGCGDEEAIDNAVGEFEEEFEAILYAIFRDLTECDTESSRKINERELEDSKLANSEYNKDKPVGTTPPEQKEKDGKFVTKIANSVKQVQEASDELHARAKQRAGQDAADEDIVKAKLEIVNENPAREAANITLIKSVDGTSHPDLLTQSLAYLDPDKYSTLTPELYDEALDSLVYIMGVNEKEVKPETVQDKDIVKRMSDRNIEHFAYKSVIGQFNDRMPNGSNPSKLHEFKEMADFYGADRLAPRIAGSDTIVYQVQREALAAKAFRAVVEVERLKKMLDKERMLAIMLATELKKSNKWYNNYIL